MAAITLFSGMAFATTSGWPSSDERRSRAEDPVTPGFQMDVTKAAVSDPTGDTLGAATTQIDVVDFAGEVVGDDVIFRISLAEAISPINSGQADAIGGYIDIDVDQDGATGDVPWVDFLSGNANSGMGNELYVDLFSYDSADGSVDLVDDADESVIARVPAMFELKALVVSIPTEAIGDLNAGIHTAVVVGTLAEATDIAPNQGALAVSSSGTGFCNSLATLTGERFEARVTWRTEDSGVQPACVSNLRTEDTAMFYFFEPNNLELMLKVLDGCSINGHFWIFFAGVTNVEMSITVTDTLTGESRVYENELGHAADAVTDVTAFATCM